MFFLAVGGQTSLSNIYFFQRCRVSVQLYLKKRQNVVTKTEKRAYGSAECFTFSPDVVYNLSLNRQTHKESICCIHCYSIRNENRDKDRSNMPLCNSTWSTSKTIAEKQSIDLRASIFAKNFVSLW